MKSKAYCFSNASDYYIEDMSEKITFAKTAGKAKQYFSMEKGSIKHVYLYRQKQNCLL